MNWSYKPGLRAVKTTIVVFLCLLIQIIFKRENAFYATIAAVVCLQSTYVETFKSGKNRLVGTVIGGFFGYIVIEFCMMIPYYHEYWIMLIVPAGIFLLIYICNVLDRKASVAICCIVFLSITANSSRDITNALTYVIDRVLDTSIGIILAMVVNRFIAPHKKETKKEILNPTNPELTDKVDNVQ
ncbi:aromatic acid exporter family protein [Paludicola sp. MB14-C6]|uniref:FUSC family protein n=1 Tax=Paludihabitans sp. MB14-C6 TaxID=3070656 RepID=UPI0027DD66D3|nr:FUSC family protein [Paludicola sp. MB14-C6]WMJ22292.1 aromatic acid exporter family protein [Paludicola sp. MB14-C6]